jgi:hypothetical protein
MKLAVCIAGLLILAACSTEGTVTPLTGGAVPLPTASTWALSVRGCPEASECEDLRTSLAGRVIGAGLAERVVAPGQPADRSLDVLVTRVRTVSGVERVFLSVLAGRNEVASTDSLRDRTGAVLRSFKVESASASHPLSGESGLADAYRQFATDTVSALR